MTTFLDSFDLLGSPRRMRSAPAPAMAFDAPVWPRVERRSRPSRAARSTPSMDAPVWPGVEVEPPIQRRSAPPPLQLPDPVPDVPAHLRRATIAPRLATEEVYPLPPERLEGPAELEFDELDADWFREGTMETAPQREETPPPPPIPLWAFALPLASSVAVFGMGLAVAYLALFA